MAIRIKRKLLMSGMPPGGWEDVEPVTGVRCSGTSWKVLVDREMEILRSNNITPPENFVSEIESRIAARLPADCVYDDAVPAKKVVARDAGKVVMQLSAVEEKTRRLKQAWESSGKPTVTQEDAIARSEVCITCPMNRPAGCLTCNGVFQRMQQWLGKLRTPNDKRLQVCGVDMVFNKVNVWLHKKVFLKMLLKGMRYKTSAYPESCWKRKELETEQ
jgi:hypothetical protein